jgi:hypothetical protein
MDDVRDPPDLGDPPEVPEVPRRVRLYPAQWIGIPFLMVVPVLAALGVFGEVRSQVETSDGTFRLHVDHPARMRMGQRSGVAVRVENLTASALDTVTVYLDPDYFTRFVDVLFTPEPRDRFQSEIVGLPPGETSLVHVELVGWKAWRHSGWIAARAGEREAVELPIRTLVFP